MPEEGVALKSHKEVFASHIETHNCPTGDCDILRENEVLNSVFLHHAVKAGLDSLKTTISLAKASKGSSWLFSMTIKCPFPVTLVP